MITASESRVEADPTGHFSVTGLDPGERLVFQEQPGATAVALPGRERLRGRIALIGTRQLEDQDYFQTAADLGRDSHTFGVEIHGWVIDNLLAQRELPLLAAAR